jgi:hypothetical protein
MDVDVLDRHLLLASLPFNFCMAFRPLLFKT